MFDLEHLSVADGAGADAGDEALIAAMAAHPALIERPIAVVGNRAAVGRPLDNIEALLP